MVAPANDAFSRVCSYVAQKSHDNMPKPGMLVYLQGPRPVWSSLLQFKSCSLVTQLHLLLLLVQLQVPIGRVKSICSLQQLRVWNNNEDADSPSSTRCTIAPFQTIDGAGSRIPPCYACIVPAGFHSQGALSAAAEVRFGWWKNWRTSESLTQWCRLLSPFSCWLCTWWNNSSQNKWDRRRVG